MKYYPRDKKLELDVGAPMSVIRTLGDLQNVLGSKIVDSELLDAQASTAIIRTKKKINIPITDVTIDQEYEKMVNSNFIVPKSYIHYSRRIGDETDITLNYNLDMNVSEYICV
jgi:hypothetical protein